MAKIWNFFLLLTGMALFLKWRNLTVHGNIVRGKNQTTTLVHRIMKTSILKRYKVYPSRMNTIDICIPINCFQTFSLLHKIQPTGAKIRPQNPPLWRKKYNLNVHLTMKNMWFFCFCYGNTSANLVPEACINMLHFQI